MRDSQVGKKFAEAKAAHERKNGRPLAFTYRCWGCHRLMLSSIHGESGFTHHHKDGAVYSYIPSHETNSGK